MYIHVLVHVHVHVCTCTCMAKSGGIKQTVQFSVIVTDYYH